MSAAEFDLCALFFTYKRYLLVTYGWIYPNNPLYFLHFPSLVQVNYATMFGLATVLTEQGRSWLWRVVDNFCIGTIDMKI